MTASSTEITGISSMATRGLLAELARAYEASSGRVVAIESVGGVAAAQRVRAGERFDVVVLAGDVIEQLLAEGHLVAGSDVNVVRSRVAIAVHAGAPRPDVGSEEAVLRAVLAARTIGTSTGPSGVALGRLFEGWGIAAQIRDRIVTPPPGVPVGTLVARGEVELGFQQLSELASLDGITVLGPLPSAIQIVTTFSAAIGAAARDPEAARALLAFVCSPAVTDVKRRHGMEPADAEPAARGIDR